MRALMPVKYATIINLEVLLLVLLVLNLGIQLAILALVVT